MTASLRPVAFSYHFCVHYLSLSRNKSDLGKPETSEQAQPPKYVLALKQRIGVGSGVGKPKQEQKDG